MGHKSILGTLNELEGNEARIYFQNYLRHSVREAIVEIMDEEVELLCGSRHLQSNPSEYKRAGSEHGIYFDEGRRKPIKRPRVRKDGKEVNLMTYEIARDPENISEEVYRQLCSGVSSREYQYVKQGETISRSEASRMWMSKAKEKFEEFRSRDISQYRFCCLMLDGVELSKDVTGIVALGIDINGEKILLDFIVGASENFEVCKDLMRRIAARDIHFTEQFLCVLDGSNALKKAVRSCYQNVRFQRCLIHKERNLNSYLSYRDRAECSRLVDLVRKSEGEKDAREAVGNLSEFLIRKNKAAYNSLLEAGDELITLQILGAPSTLNVSLLSTNIIENTIKNIRRKIYRVTRWRADTPQAERWLASGLLYAERGFRKIKGYRDLPELVNCLTVPAGNSCSHSKTASVQETLQPV